MAIKQNSKIVKIIRILLARLFLRLNFQKIFFCENTVKSRFHQSISQGMILYSSVYSQDRLRFIEIFPRSMPAITGRLKISRKRSNQTAQRDMRIAKKLCRNTLENFISEWPLLIRNDG